MLAYACKISTENLMAMASESGSKFDMSFATNWLEEHGEGYFLRDENSALDCSMFVDTIFLELYKFVDKNDVEQLFRRVEKV